MLSAFVCWGKYITLLRKYSGFSVVSVMTVLSVLLVHVEIKNVFQKCKAFIISVLCCYLASVTLWSVLHRKSLTVK